jgi:hypothetical protein
MARLSAWDEERHGRPLAPVSLPRFNLTDLDVEAEAREAVARVAERRIIRNGLDAWREINRAESFEGWRAIGAALAVGKAHGLRVTGANAAWGRNYSREFGTWMKRHGFDAMAKSVRSVAIELHENAKAIEAWRATLPERQRRRLVHPLSNVRRWRAATTHNGKCPQDLKRDAVAVVAVRCGWVMVKLSARCLPENCGSIGFVSCRATM